MENYRLLLIISLTFTAFLLWESWHKFQAARLAPPLVVSTPVIPGMGDVPAVSVGTATPTAGAEAVPTLPTASAALTPQAEPVKQGQRITVETDLLHLEIDALGGDMRQAVLKQYPISVDQPEQGVVLLNDTSDRLFILQSGWLGEGAPTHTALFTPEKTEYRLEPGQNEFQVRLHWRGEGLEIIKVYTFKRGSYTIGLSHEVHNLGAAVWQGREYRQLQRIPAAELNQSSMIYTYMGGVIYNPKDKYLKVSFDDMKAQDLTKDASQGWAAMVQHYFLAALIPPAEQENHYYSKTLPGNRYVLGLVAPQTAVAPQQTQTVSTTLYLGPKLQDSLGTVAKGLELTVDYGLLTIIAEPRFWLLAALHKLTGNWGWAIILITALIKIAFYKLSETSYRSMAQMRKLQPKMQALKERYADDKEKFNQALMEMYRKDKINPLGGCLPILLQIPFFIALYWVLLESVELRQADFIFWLTDLSREDPYFVLPLLMGISMFIQQKLNPAPLDPVQEKVMLMLPMIFTVFFAFFPAGLVLYWFFNNLFSIAQQWMITRQIEKSA